MGARDSTKDLTSATPSNLGLSRQLSKSSMHSHTKSIQSSMVGGKKLTARELRKFEIKPTIQEMMAITQQWWDAVNPGGEYHVPYEVVIKLLCDK